MTDIEFIEDLLNDYFALRTRDVENSGIISPSWYKQQDQQIIEERAAAYTVLTRIREKLGDK